MAQNFEPDIEYKNRKASFEYHLEKLYEAGIQLTGTEVKSVRHGGVNMGDAYCYFTTKSELLIRKLHISEYKYGNDQNHDPLRARKLLLKKRELKQLQKKVKERGFSIVPVRLFVNERGLIKIDIALARGKKVYDKRDSIKKKDQKRDLQRNLKY
jgi:SsrA-binding protein